MASDNFKLKSIPLRIAEIYANQQNREGPYSTLIKHGKPSIYRLNTKNNHSEKSVDIRWFDIEEPKLTTSHTEYPHQEHKVIILMGATGSGKSTLINGMVNYIMGVQWADPFRFDVIQKDENAGLKQSSSQTTSVTAYTLRHQPGMAIPYSITIIDTPGYGDTGGMQRDREITETIHKFLAENAGRVDRIHAVCFVAASGDSRLTFTQRYILDSVLSIFGKDVKDNIRLLVTFADNADPPVVQACRVGGFPLPPGLYSITCSKFNSSVLYANNENNKQEDEGSNFDKLFWDMGQENFKKFFDMLETMNGCDLESTRQVIEHRRRAQQTLRDVKSEIESYLVDIENIEALQRFVSLNKSRPSVVSMSGNHAIEKTEMQSILVPCKSDFSAYNCANCKQTCVLVDNNSVEQFRRNLSETNCNCSPCHCATCHHDIENLEWAVRPVKVTTTLGDIRTRYERSSTSNGQTMSLGQLMAACVKDLAETKAKLITTFRQMDDDALSLDSIALRSSAFSATDRLSLLRSQIAEEQAPGYITRLEILAELQLSLTTVSPDSHQETCALEEQISKETTETLIVPQQEDQQIDWTITEQPGIQETKPEMKKQNDIVAENNDNNDFFGFLRWLKTMPFCFNTKAYNPTKS